MKAYTEENMQISSSLGPNKKKSWSVECFSVFYPRRDGWTQDMHIDQVFENDIEKFPKVNGETGVGNHRLG